ncbi:hypothetical protein EFO87_14645, partial [Lactiplantibacillus plantarum]|nr:hypothetical protein [Lactiplantibacillus plantarum]
VHSWGMPPVMFSVITKYHKGRHSLFLYNSEIFYAFTQDILRSQFPFNVNHGKTNQQDCGSGRRLSTGRITARERRS